MAQTLSQIKGRQAAALQEDVAFVEMTGDDGSAALGNAGLPFATAQAAYNAVYAAYLADSTKSYLVRFGVGTWAGIVTTHSAHPAGISFAGAGAEVSFLGGLTNNDPETAGASVVINGDESINLGPLIVTGTNGAEDLTYDADPASPGGNGLSSTVTLTQCVTGDITATGGYGGRGGGNAYAATNGGNGADAVVSLTACTVGNVTTAAGGGGQQGTNDDDTEAGSYGYGGNSIINIQRSAYVDLTRTYNLESGADAMTGGSVTNDYGIDGTVGSSPSSNQKIGY